MSTLPITAEAIVYGVAVLMNDPKMTDYNYETVSPYIALAMGDLTDALEEANVAITNEVSQIYRVNVGENTLTNPPIDMVEIQEVGERAAGSNDAFIPLPRKEFPDSFPTSNSLGSWCWKNLQLCFNTNGANTPREIQLKYIRQYVFGFGQEGPNKIVGTLHSHSFLVYKTAALCSTFIAENPSRAAILEDKAEKSLETIIAVSNKGKQQMTTRRRPFRAGYKSRGY